MQAFPVIKIEIEEMKHAILHHFNAYQSKLSDYVREQIEIAIQCYDFESEVKKAVDGVITQALEQYFKWGDGNKLISKTLTEALNKTFNIQVDEY